MINVTKPYQPNKQKFLSLINRVYEKGTWTNNGPLVQELEKRLASFLGVENIVLVSSGTMALQFGYKALELTGEVITTPFSFVATRNSLLWEGLTPKFADIDRETYNISPKAIEQVITEKTSAIMPVHVFGNPCEMDEISALAQKWGLKVIYDAAHAFGVKYDGKSVLTYGDVSILSFHATKLFHTLEGGAVITCDAVLAEKVRSLRNFGLAAKQRVIGINGKMNEIEAAVGLCILDDIEVIHAERQEIFNLYARGLKDYVFFQNWNPSATRNYSYAPILLSSEELLVKIIDDLKAEGVSPRRYFFPNLDEGTGLSPSNQSMAAEDVSKRILCLPIYPGLEVSRVKKIN